MHKVHEKSVTDCLECDLSAQERLNYFTGQFLAERDFRLEQDYLIGKHRQHNRYLHGWGTVCGLKVVQHPNPDCRDRFVVIEPGLALDCCGREIVVREEVYVDLAKYLAPVDPDEGQPDGPNLLISVCYAECKTEHVPALYSECGCEEGRCEPSRVREGYEVKIERVSRLPEPPQNEAVGVSLSWITTLSLTHATRLALDNTAERLFVLTSANSGQIVVYDTNHHCLLRTIDIQAQGVDLALSPTGNFLYVLRHVTGAPGDYFLRVIDVQDLNNPVTTNDLPLSSGALTSAPKVVVAEADGRVYTLDPNATPDKKVIIWKTAINTAGVDPNLPPSNPASPKFAEVTTGTDPRDIAVSPDGIWLFIAEANPGDKKITAVKVQTLTSSPVTHSIAVADTPVLLTTSADSLRLVAGTAGKMARAFHIEETPSPFPEIGSGVDVGPEDPIAVQSSPAGKWIYVLSKDAANKGWVRAVNVEKFETDAANAVGNSAPVVAAPQDLLLAPDGRTVFVAGEGLTGQCGGVSVLNVNEEPCAEIFWRALEGCPTCNERCVPLAAVRDYTDGQVITDRAIDNRIRPLAPSTETLRQVILCALEHGAGAQGPEGPRGLPGADGSRWFSGNGPPAVATGTDGDYYLNTANGDVLRKVAGVWTNEGNIKGPKGDPGVGSPGPAGPGLEAGLTQISALSWNHNRGNNPLVPIFQPSATGQEVQIGQGFVIGFSKKVLVSNPANPIDPPDQMDAEHVFEVLIQNPRDQELRLVCWCSVAGRILPVKFFTDNPPANNHINRALVVDGPLAVGAAFLVPEEALAIVKRANEVWVRLRGDFVIDQAGRAVDAEFARAQLPTGDRPATSPHGIQGGLFESWLWIDDRPGPQFTDRILINSATVDQLVTLPGITDRIARRIIERRNAGRFETVDDLLEISGLSARILENIRDRISVD